ncbi:hypothetical protein NP493_1481g00020 [Ridgeia piscesae]|uniref:Serpin domain-containing protein n=1 Tax=Ridgeia piscesae TaxID=27915 RepID=A0AAD9NAI1_RIDPI|nr:hypothetical protein NP493_1481g00020 [Ridgeia piscesae]
MTYAGARGRTLSQMRRVLHFNRISAKCSVHEGFRGLLTELLATKYSHVLKVANRIFIDQRFSILDNFAYITKHNYGAKAVKLPFFRTPNLARKNINRWVSRKTDGKITSLLPRGSVTKQTALTLVNAITFKGNWLYKFTGYETTLERFYKSKTTLVEMMRMTVAAPYLRYANDRSLHAEILELPYVDTRVAFYVVLPYRSSSLSALEQQFRWNPDALDLKPRRMLVRLPKFTVRSKVNLAGQLRDMGMRDLFGAADLRGIDGKRDLFVPGVFHEAYIKVSETGTDAGAATAVLQGKSYLRDFGETFVANRPYLFFIWDRSTSSLLFSGRFCG